ncbi:MAG: DUF3015 family protein [Porticoccaceae bacterium]|nr:DUF3015 family protein [Porticoccaceae bacterium]
MRINQYSCIALTLFACISTPAFAEMGNKAAGSGPNPFVDCGIGASLFPNTHWAAVTSNVIWDVGSTALTSATASPETCQGAKVEAAMFIKETYPNLIEETAAGQGEHLSAVMQILGCSADSYAAIVDSVRAEMGLKVSSDGYSSMDQLQKSADFYAVINSVIEKTHSDSCAA